MFTIIPEVGPASWIARPSFVIDEASNFSHFRLEFSGPLDKVCFALNLMNVKVTNGSFFKEKQMQIVHYQRDCGNNYLEKKQFNCAFKMFCYACKRAENIIKFDGVEISLLYCSLASCCLKLDNPIDAMIYLKNALKHDLYNVQAHLHVLSSLYMMYYFSDAMKVISSCLTRNPELQELHVFKKKLLKNKIKQKFSDVIIQKRLDIYRKSLALQPKSLHDIGKDVILLLQSVKINKGHECLDLAKNVLDRMFKLMDHFICCYQFDEAEVALIDMYYFIHFLQETHHEVVDDDKLYLFHVSRGKCFYYKENFLEALKSCCTAGHYVSDSTEVLILKAKALLKLNRYEEALETINRCIKIVEANSVEAVICEEVLLEIQLHDDIHKYSSSSNPEFNPDSNGFDKIL